MEAIFKTLRPSASARDLNLFGVPDAEWDAEAEKIWLGFAGKIPTVPRRLSACRIRQYRTIRDSRPPKPNENDSKKRFKLGGAAQFASSEHVPNDSRPHKKCAIGDEFSRGPSA